MTGKITWEEYQRIKDIKTLDLEICDYQHINILNLGWKPWGKWYCGKHEKEHVLCPKIKELLSKGLSLQSILKIIDEGKPKSFN
ncbi:MAG: hypothetical protein LBR43_03295 [Spiroplasmataceae bacterium]|nr:hypothetical protein [Spiroplasmataceae bacterium]